MTSPAAETDTALPATPWLVRIPEVFAHLSEEILREFEAVATTRLGPDYVLIKTPSPEAVHRSDGARFCRWNLPMEHTWPCNARKMDGFIEKAAQTLRGKFAERSPQGVFIGTLNPGAPDPYFRGLASNLRGRTLQLFPDLPAGTVEEQNPASESLFCLVGREGLFCGMQSPRASNGFYPGGSRFIDQDTPDTISRAGAKIAEALHYLRLHRPPIPEGGHWIELGACPGGMTSELLAHGYRVTAIDRAPLDRRLDGRAGLTFVRDDVARFRPSHGDSYDAILSDLNGPARESIAHVIRLTPFLKERGLVVFTLKLPQTESIAPPCELFHAIVRIAADAGLRLVAQTHLTYNRSEFTLFFEKA